MISWNRAIACVSCLATIGVGCKLKLPPAYFGKLYCFNAVGAYGEDVESQWIRAIHFKGDPVKVCFCYCDEAHADTQLFTGEDPPEPTQNWLDWIAADRDIAVKRCEDVAVDLGIVNDNCEEVMPLYPTWEQRDGECASGPQPGAEYCQEADHAGDLGTDDAGESGSTEPADLPDPADPEIGGGPAYSNTIAAP